MTFWDFLSSNTPLVIFLGVAVVAAILIIAKRVGVKKLGLGGAEFFSTSYGVVTAWIIQEESRLSEMRADMVQRHTMMRVHYLIRDQMNMTEQYMSEIAFIVSETFATLLKSHCDKGTDILHHPDFLRFERELDAGIDYLKKLLRFAVKENHLAEKSDDEFRYYVKTKIDYVTTQMRQWIIRIPAVGCVDSDTFLEELASKRPAIHEVYRKIFELARQQAIAYESAMSVERKEYEAEKARFYSELPKKLREAVE